MFRVQWSTGHDVAERECWRQVALGGGHGVHALYLCANTNPYHRLATVGTEHMLEAIYL